MRVKQARLYTRVSTLELQARGGYSLDAQLERLEAFCVSQGWRIAGRYSDEGVSAKNTDRPAFQRMLAEAEEGDVILVYKLDRLTRSVRDLDDLLKIFEQRKIFFHSLTEYFDTSTAAGRLMLRMIAEIAQWERETIAERSAFGVHQKMYSGWFHGIEPFGYVLVPTGEVKRGREVKRIVPDPKTSHIVKMMYEKYLAGYGVRAIAKWLNEEVGVRTKNGGLWRSNTVSYILRNPVYCGEIDVTKIKRSDSDPDTVPGSHEPIISREMFDAVQKRLQERKSTPPRASTGQYPLAYLAHCGICGSSIKGYKTRNKRYYRCESYDAGKGCGLYNGKRALTATNAEKCEQNLIEQIAKLQQPDDLQRLIEDYAKAEAVRLNELDAEIDRLRSEIEETDKAIYRWKRLYERGKMDEDEYLAEVTPHKERLESMQKRLSELEAQQAIIPQHEVLKQASIDIVSAWNDLPLPERKALLKDFLDAFNLRVLLYHGGRVELVPGV